MPNRSQRVFSALCQFIDLAIRVPPLFLLHWHLAEDFFHPLKHQIQQLADPYGILNFAISVALVILVIIGVTMTTSKLIMSYVLLSPLVYFHWPRLISIEGAASNTAQEPDRNNPNISFKALYTWPLLLYAIKNRISSPFRTSISVPFCFISVVFFGPGVFKGVMSIHRHLIYVTFSPPQAAAAACTALLCGMLVDWRPLRSYISRFRPKVRAYCNHERSCTSLCELLKAPRIFYVFCFFRLIGLTSVMIEERYAFNAPITWTAFGEELLVRCCDSTVSVVSLGCVAVRAVDLLILLLEAFLHERDVEEEGFKSEMFVFSFALSYDAEYLLLDRAISHTRLCQFIVLYVMSRLLCVHETIYLRLKTFRSDPDIDIVKFVRLSFGNHVILASSWGLLEFARRYDTAWFMTFGCIFAELNLRIFVTLVICLLYCTKMARGGVWHSFDNYLRTAGRVQRGLESTFFVFFVWNNLYAVSLMQPDIFCALDVRLFTYVNVWSQEDRYRRLKLQREEAKTRTMKFPKATSEELVRLNDICSICFGEMRAAVRTYCNHFFHEECLMTWWILQKNCPFCRSTSSR